MRLFSAKYSYRIVCRRRPGIARTPPSAHRRAAISK
jgi:hypothetical protein